ncbi:MAG: HEAT repeat domain-containing protein, partial [Candidatus Cybelea sp.]
ERSEGLRRAAAGALGRLAGLVENVRTAAIDALEQLIGDETFLVAISAIAAAESLGDVRLLPALERIAEQGFDGRMRRDATEAAIRIRKNSKVPTQVKILRDDIDELRAEQRRLQEKIETIARP